jgi:hypothetical protein
MRVVDIPKNPAHLTGGSRTIRNVCFASMAIAALIFSLPGVAAAGKWPQTRQGWTLGLGVGGGSAAPEGEERKGGAAASFRVGYVFTPQLGAGLESNAWSADVDGDTWTFSVSAAALTFYPAPEQGFFLRGGVGVGSVTVDLGSSFFGSTHVSEQGFGVTGGAGYEWRVARTVALAPQVDFSYVSVNDLTANYVNGSLQINWYFIPRK